MSAADRLVERFLQGGDRVGGEVSAARVAVMREVPLELRVLQLEITDPGLEPIDRAGLFRDQTREIVEQDDQDGKAVARAGTTASAQPTALQRTTDACPSGAIGPARLC
ncbi:hypothetical protein AB0D04_05805 [Streptomyces sp. NPDC048483]|uniref:hypothetical protein n=1 Tax=Streptomyces sp. NPDC048483 TaxID=3154927 RepID=UPI003431682E